MKPLFENNEKNQKIVQSLYGIKSLQNKEKINNFGTDTLKEDEILNWPLFIKEFIKLSDLSDNQLTNKRILVINIECLARYFSLNNDVVYLSTDIDKVNAYRKYYNNISIFVKPRKNKMLKVDKYLDMKTSLNSFDYIIGNPPYDRDLYLSVAEQLHPFLKEGGKEMIIGPTLCIDNPFYYDFVNKHKNLFTYLSDVEYLNKEMIECFESFKGYTNLAIISFDKKKTFNNINALWKNGKNGKEISLVEKLMSKKIIKISNVCKEITNSGIFVPIGNIGGGKHYLVFDKVFCIKDGMILCNVSGKRKEYVLKWLTPKECEEKKIKYTNIGIKVNSLKEAETIYNAYRNFDTLRGICTLSRFGSQHVKFEFIPYYCTNNEEEIKQDLRLDENDVLILKNYAKCDSYLTVNFASFKN